MGSYVPMSAPFFYFFVVQCTFFPPVEATRRERRAFSPYQKGSTYFFALDLKSVFLNVYLMNTSG